MGMPFDQDGKMGSSGTFLKSWYASLVTPHFYQKKGPKSISNEWVEQEVLAKLPEREKPKDLAFTYCKFVGDRIAESLSGVDFNTVLLTGGGAYNKALLEAIEGALGVKVVVPKPEIINFKEALIFSFMAVLKLRKEVNVLKSVTGALEDTSSGVYYNP
jgi:anhydro-N-acetylmuramic acid kinase